MAQEAPLFSVIIPTQGRASVRDAVDSVLAQSEPSFEVIVVTDGDAGLADPCLSGVSDSRVLRASQPSSGVCAARNLGVAHATGTWITFLDDDDTARPEWLATWASAIEADTAVVTARLAFHEAGVTREVSCELDPANETVGASRLLAAGFAVKRELFLAVGGYDERLRHSENLELGLRLCDHLSGTRQNSVRHVQRVVADLMVERSRSRIARYGTAPGEAAALLLDRHAARFARDRGAKVAFLRILSRSRRLQGDRSGALDAAWEALALNPKDSKNWKVAAAALIPGVERPVLRALDHLQRQRLSRVAA